jgi:CysZ protein
LKKRTKKLLFLKEVTLFTPIVRAFGQLGDPALLMVLIETVLLSALCFAGLAAGAVWVMHALVANDTLGWILGAVSGTVSLLGALWLFLPIAVVIAGLFMEPVCRAVERRWHPGLPPAQAAHIAARLWDGVVLGLQVLALDAVSLLLAPTGIGFAAGWLITAWAVGRGLFMAVAMRRMTRPAALRAYRMQRLNVLAQGAALTLGGSMPLLNLLLPIVGPAAMVHVLQGTPPRDP